MGAHVTLSCFSVVDHYPSGRHPGHTRTVERFYRQLLDECLLAERLGYDTFFVAEHHFHEYGAIPNPAVWMAAAAVLTSRIRLGPAVSVLPFHDPRVVAEDYAMVDQLSRGRVVFGAGSGYLAHEFQGFGVDPATKRARFDEALEIVRRLWRGERLTLAGTHHGLCGVELNVRPWRDREIPVYVAALRREALYWIGRNGLDAMIVPYATVDRFEEIGDLVAEFRRGRADGGHDGGEVIVALHTHVAESDEAARAEAAAAFDLYVDTRLYARRQTYEDIQRSGLSLMGGVETVAEKLRRLAEMGVRHVAALYNFGDLPTALARRSLERLMGEAAPRSGVVAPPAGADAGAP